MKRWVCINISAVFSFFHTIDYLKEFLVLSAVYGLAKLKVEIHGLLAFYECESFTWPHVKI